MEFKGYQVSIQPGETYTGKQGNLHHTPTTVNLHLPDGKIFTCENVNHELTEEQIEALLNDTESNIYQFFTEQINAKEA